jgi:hypothetical protein
MMAEEFVDATIFLGMNSTDDSIRRTCASFFAARLGSRVGMSLEQIGRCDHVVWSYPREQQDAYYPFMDNLHTDLHFDRLGYEDQDLSAATDDRRPLPAAERLMLAMVANRGGTLYTLNPRLLSLPAAPVRRPSARPSGHVGFPVGLDTLYQESLVLRVDLAWL